LRINWKSIFLWSNHFYGICAALLAAESSLMLLHELPSFYTLMLIYFSTIVYYTHAYLQESKDGIYNERTSWYQRNLNYLYGRQLVLTIVIMYIAFLKISVLQQFLIAPVSVKLFLISSVALSLYYYFPAVMPNPKFAFRNKGILKSVSIAWVWTLVCFFSPIWLAPHADFIKIFSSLHYWLFFFQLFLYILILAILFDFKDIIRDEMEMVKTIVVKYGISKTLTKIIVPLLLMYLAISMYILYYMEYDWVYLTIQLVLVALTYIVGKQIVHKKSIPTHILMIDGLMIIKAILSICYFKTHLISSNFEIRNIL
jgi:4-hydroxybenzoate polyprenyltransferase